MTHNIAELVDIYKTRQKEFGLFLNGVENAFKDNIPLNTGNLPAIHSIKKRLKDEGHLKEKIERKIDKGYTINKENLFLKITDLAGLRVLHLHQRQCKDIHNFIKSNRNWRLVEKPVAYTWDPESVDFFKKLKIKTEIKPTYYTSVHYVIQPNNDENSFLKCEIQVRTLFEEIWGEIDHSMNYPDQTEKIATIEQLRVLSKLVSTGSRLANSIFKVHEI